MFFAPLLRRSRVTSFLERFPFAALLVEAASARGGSEGTAAEPDDRKAAKRTVQRRVLESFEVKRYRRPSEPKNAARLSPGAGRTLSVMVIGKPAAALPAAAAAVQGADLSAAAANPGFCAAPASPEDKTKAEDRGSARSPCECARSPPVPACASEGAAEAAMTGRPASGLSASCSPSPRPPAAGCPRFPGSIPGRPRNSSVLPAAHGGGAGQPHRCFTAPPAPYGRQAYRSSGPCPICLDEYKDEQRIRGLPCGHEYHTDCIAFWRGAADPWLLHSASYCPMCKTDYADWQVQAEAAGTPASFPSFIAALFRSFVGRDVSGRDGVVPNARM
ncbi:MAG: hypothetical protein BJ554DRAFT_4195 [Olpidium bornovanus]|uniref:RING-type E3 ubiquitin transferase n=1 Tax=Olpidium bornovanus TaxID=278681 RepID=A0A8H7ZN06_9FUNG|nr:MAG: hypothetical protein BJ554DRAFT_4195 [Olpidium bornovanus]